MGKGIRSFFGEEAKIEYSYGGRFNVTFNPDLIENEDTLLMATDTRNTTICRNGSLCIYLTPQKTFFVPGWNVMVCVDSKYNDEYYLFKVDRKYFKLYDSSPKSGYKLHPAMQEFVSRMENHKEECSDKELRFVKALKGNFSFDDLVDFYGNREHDVEAKKTVTGTLSYSLGN